MKIKLIVVGKTNAKYLLEGEREYENRLRHYTKFEEIIIPDVKKSGKLSEYELKKKEGHLILGKLENSDHVILLDDKGKSHSSVEFANFLKQKTNSGLNIARCRGVSAISSPVQNKSSTLNYSLYKSRGEAPRTKNYGPCTSPSLSRVRRRWRGR